MSPISQNQDQENLIVKKSLTKVPQPHLTGMVLNQDVRINGLTLNTITSITNAEGTPHNVVWVCTDIEGWWNLPTAEVPDIPRGLDDGSYDVRGRWTARAITLRGTIMPTDPSVAHLARQQLIDAMTLVYNGAWLFVDETPTKKAIYVRLNGQPEITNVNARGRIEFSIPLKSGDPIKYDWTGPEDSSNVSYTTGYTVTTPMTLGGSGTNLTNIGNTNVPMIFTLDGSMTAPATITCTHTSSTNVTTTQSIRITRNLRAANTTYANATNSVCSAGIATITRAAHGLYVGDVITTESFVDTYFNKTNVTVSATTTDSYSYLCPVPANITQIVVSSSSSNNVTITANTTHNLVANDVIYLSGTSNALLDGTATIIWANTTAFKITRSATAGTYGGGGTVSREKSSSTITAGTAKLVGADSLQIDTYNGTVVFRGVPDIARSTLDVSIDWIKLKPGTSNIKVITSSGTPTVTAKHRSGWIG